MSDERDKEGQGKGFTVSDRRKRYEEPAGGASESSPVAPPPAEAPEAKPTPAAAAAPAPATPAAAAAHDLGPDLGQAGAGLPGPADLLQLVGKLYQEGLAFMGLFDDPQTGQSMANFPVASWHIDILGLLEEKTKGNLTEEEAKLLKEAIANLKLTYVRASGLIKR
ncbi:MAG TPA: DUF1844 domain-containing protein [Candidatus Methanoperedens sp.]|nr:DUF1844 domain-containing protein [Candidatus Methanoperedens sp.]